MTRDEAAERAQRQANTYQRSHWIYGSGSGWYITSIEPRPLRAVRFDPMAIPKGDKQSGKVFKGMSIHY